MGNILTAEVKIRGTRPLFWNWFGPNAIPLEKEERTGVAGNDPEEWRHTHLKTAEGQLYLDPSYVFGSIRDGAKYTKKGRSSIQPLVVATLQVTDDRILIDRFFPKKGDPPRDPLQPVYIDVRGTVNPSTRARNVRYRVAAAAGWHAAFHLLWDSTIVSREQLQAATIDAGRLSGVGNARKIGMGRFEVLSFNISEPGAA